MTTTTTCKCVQDRTTHAHWLARQTPTQAIMRHALQAILNTNTLEEAHTHAKQALTKAAR